MQTHLTDSYLINVETEQLTGSDTGTSATVVELLGLFCSCAATAGVCRYCLLNIGVYLIGHLGTCHKYHSGIRVDHELSQASVEDLRKMRAFQRAKNDAASQAFDVNVASS